MKFPLKKSLDENSLESGEDRYKLLFNNMLDSFALHRIIVDNYGKPCDYEYIEVNSAFERMTGLKRKDIIGKRVTVVLPGTQKDPADWIGKYGEVALYGKKIHFENYSAALKKWFNISAYSPKTGYFATIFEDITDRKYVEEVLQSKAALLEAQTNANMDGILVIGYDNTRLLINQRLMKFFDAPKSILEDKDDSRLLKYVVGINKFPEEFLKKVKYLNSHPDETSKDEIEFKNGTIFERYSAPVLDKDGKNFARIWTFHDITDRKKVEEELKKSRDALQSKVSELERFNKFAIDREIKMVELKNRIKELEDQLSKRR